MASVAIPIEVGYFALCVGDICSQRFLVASSLLLFFGDRREERPKRFAPRPGFTSARRQRRIGAGCRGAPIENVVEAAFLIAREPGERYRPCLLAGLKAGQASDASRHNTLLDGLDQRIDARRRSITSGDLVETAIGDRDMPAPDAQWPHDGPAYAIEHYLRADDPVRKGD
ncbi:MAG: hypothetical protein FD152_1531 [Xanthobacteraceae bacterium]|nr:MAG: hypothetical protein FD152_1531 [Xanthobacteraceae bacterium]